MENIGPLNLGFTAIKIVLNSSVVSFSVTQIGFYISTFCFGLSVVSVVRNLTDMLSHITSI
jgi:predicted transporter